VIASDQKRLVVDAFRYRSRNALRFYQSVGTIQAQHPVDDAVDASLRRVLGEVTFISVRDEREALMGRIRDQLDHEADGYGIQVVDVGIRRADLPEAEQPAVYSACRPSGSARLRNSERSGRSTGDPLQRRPRSTVIVAEANSPRGGCSGEATASATGCSPSLRRIRFLRLSTAR